MASAEWASAAFVADVAPKERYLEKGEGARALTLMIGSSMAVQQGEDKQDRREEGEACEGHREEAPKCA